MTTQIVDTFTKHSSEIITKVVSFTDRLPSGATVSSASIEEAVDLTDGSDVSSGGSTITAAPSTTTSSTSVLFQNGTDGHDYQLAVKSVLSDGSYFVDMFVMQVRDRPSD